MMISQIVASGCSFTYGYGLSNPTEESWSGQLSKLLNLDCINLAMNGVGNDFIINSLIDYFIKNKNLRDKSLVIIGLTSYSRIEFLRKHSEEVFYTNLSSWKEKEFIKNFFEERFNERFYYLKFLRKIILLQSLLKNWNVSYIMFEALDNGHQSFKNDL